MKQIQIRNLSHTDNTTLLNCFNISFSDYVIPFRLNLPQLETKLRTESVDKSISIGAFRGDQLIGFVLHGQRRIDDVQVAYNGGTGVIPEERGQKITRKMYEFILPILKQRGFEEVVLEVISTNTPAISSYDKIGFKEIRHLSCFKGKPLVRETNRHIRIEEVKAVHFDEVLQFGEIEPTWQNSKATILELGNAVRYFLAFNGDAIYGYCFLNNANHRILQIAVKKELRNGLIGSSLLHAIGHAIRGPISIINVDDGFRSTLDFFEKRDMKKTLGQLEMRLKIRY